MIGTFCVGAIQIPQLAVTGAPKPLLFSPALVWAVPVWLSWDPCLSYVTAVLLLAVGLTIAIKKAPPQASGLDKLILCGPVFIGMPMVVFGTEHYLFHATIGGIIPAWIPAHTFWVYLVGTCLILGGVSILVHIQAGLSAGLFGIMLLCFEVLLFIPSVVRHPHIRLAWAYALRDLSFSCGALAFAATHALERRPKGAHLLISLVRTVLGIVVVAFALEYFFHPELLPGVPLEQLTPTFIPGHLLWGYCTSVAYVVAGVCLIINNRVRLAAEWMGLLVLVAVIFLCVPYMVQHASDVGMDSGLNVPVDTLILSGGLLCLAGSQRERSAGSNKSTT
jgi:uncharacterized membrane protein